MAIGVYSNPKLSFAAASAPPPPSRDVDAAAFMVAIGIADDATVYYSGTSYERTGEQLFDAIDDFIVGLKTASIWDDVIALYPFLGGTATRHQYNAKNPLDTNAAFRLSFAGGITHDELGITGNGTNGYFNTHLKPSTSLTSDSASMGAYIRTNTSATTQDFGIFVNSASDFLLIPKWSTGAVFADLYNSSTNRITSAITRSDRLILMSRTSSIDSRIFRDGIQVGSTNTNASSGHGSLGSNSVYGLARNDNGTANLFSSRNVSFFFLASGLSGAKVNTLNTLVNTYQTALGRNV